MQKIIPIILICAIICGCSGNGDDKSDEPTEQYTYHKILGRWYASGSSQLYIEFVIGASYTRSDGKTIESGNFAFDPDKNLLMMKSTSDSSYHYIVNFTGNNTAIFDDGTLKQNYERKSETQK